MKCFLLVLILLTFAPLAHAQTASVVEKARVTSIVSEQIHNVSGTNVIEESQTLDALIVSGPGAGQNVSVENDDVPLAVGDTFFLTGSAGQYNVSDVDRLPALGILAGFFVLAIVIFGGWTGVRALLALAASALVIIYALLPALIAGYDPTLVSLGVAAFIVLIGSYLTHGVSRTTTTAVAGMILTLAFTAVITYFAIHAAKLSGASDEATLDLVAGGIHLDLVGLLFGSMLIGTLGILYDAAIGQAVAVEELWRATPAASRAHIFARAMRVGREHIGALVNTLVIAYVGISLPLLLLFQSYADEPFLQTINRELFATELVRAMTGSIGIVLAIPLTTLVAVYLLVRR